MVSFESAEHQDDVVFVFPDLSRDFFEFSGRQRSLRAELRSSDWCPSVDGSPSQLEDLAFQEALEAVRHAEGIVTGQDAVADEGPGLK